MLISRGGELLGTDVLKYNMASLDDAAVVVGIAVEVILVVVVLVSVVSHGVVATREWLFRTTMSVFPTMHVDTNSTSHTTNLFNTVTCQNKSPFLILLK